MLLCAGCASLPESMRPEVKDWRPRVTGIDLNGIDLAFDVDVLNKFPVAVKAPAFETTLSVMDTRFISTLAAEGFDLPASGVGTATIPARVTFADLLSLGEKLAGANQANYEIKGAVKIPVMGRLVDAPISHAGTFPILRAPKIAVTRYQAPEVTLQGARLGVEALVENPNVFGIGLRDVGYSLRIGGVNVADLTASTLGEIAAGGSGGLSLAGRVTAADVLRGVFSLTDLGAIQIAPTGEFTTPYGPIKLP